MKVSIIIPVYNVEKYIIRCIDSVCKQTYNDIECILVDDCGNDNSITLAEEYIKKYSGNIHFNLLHHTQNKGLSGARNTGIKAATGDFIYFLDSDDAVTPNCIATLVQLAKKYPQADFVQGNLLGDDGKQSPYAFNDKFPEFCNDKNHLEYLMLHCIITSACNRLIKRSIILEHLIFFPLGIVHEDMYWVYFFAKHTKAAVFTPTFTYIYSVHEGSIMTTVSREMRVKRISSRLYATDAYYKDLKESTTTSYSRRAYLSMNLFSCLHELIQLHSLKHWIFFWLYVCKIGIRNLPKVTLPRILFLLILLPPACFFARNEKIRWRIQNKIINRI